MKSLYQPMEWISKMRRYIAEQNDTQHKIPISAHSKHYTLHYNLIVHN